METTAVQQIVGIRFSKVGKIYHFQATNLPPLRAGDAVVVETARGWQIGEVAQIVKEPMQPPEGGWKPIERVATPRDLLLRQLWQLRELDVVEVCRRRASELRLQNLKVVAAEYSFDGSRLTILYSTEGEERVDLKSLRQDMQRQYAPAMVELRQIGPRDVAKLLGGMGACGLETRCCSRFLTEFSSISIRMAKEQGISLTPTEITGMCGRLRCCLIYEFDTYVEARKGLPKRNKRIATPLGEGKVIDVLPLAGKVRVDIPEVGVREFTREEILAFSEPPVESGDDEAVMEEENTEEYEADNESVAEDESGQPEQLSGYPQPSSTKPRRRSGGRGGRRKRGPKKS